MPERKSIIEMLGEFFREAAVLTAVFIPLDRALLGEPLTIWAVITIIGISGGSLALGIGLERRRKR
jgi:hypothetical protein